MTGPARRSLRLPPGRAGRLWLERRLVSARRGAELLDRKLRLLLQEERRCAARVESSRQAWEAACGEARYWGLLAAALGDETGPAAGAPAAADVEVEWASVLGVTYPARVRYEPPVVDGTLIDPTGALPPARAAYRRAAEAAARHAAATASAAVLGAEVTATRQRLRAIEDRWVPALEDALARLRTTLAEEETSDAARLHRAQR